MSLKMFHMFFITIAALLVLGFGDWSLRIYLAEGKSAYGVLSLLSLAAVAALFGYGAWFVDKARSILR